MTWEPPLRESRVREDHTPDAASLSLRERLSRGKSASGDRWAGRPPSEKRAVFLRTLPRPRKGCPEAVQREATTWATFLHEPLTAGTGERLRFAIGCARRELPYERRIADRCSHGAGVTRDAD